MGYVNPYGVCGGAHPHMQESCQGIKACHMQESCRGIRGAFPHMQESCQGIKARQTVTIQKVNASSLNMQESCRGIKACFSGAFLPTPPMRVVGMIFAAERTLVNANSKNNTTTCCVFIPPTLLDILPFVYNNIL